MPKYIPLRCPSEHRHGIYDLCGRLIGALLNGTEDNYSIHYCPDCGILWEVSVDPTDGITMREMQGKLEFVSSTKVIIE